jgi:hypothetical protein
LLLFGTLLSKLEILLSSGILLGLQLLSLNLLGLLLEDGFDQDSSVFELVTLGGEVELVVEGAIDLLCLSVLPEQSSEDSLSANPQDFGGHSCLPGTSAFTSTSVISLALGFEVESGTGAGVNFLLALHDETVLDEFADEDAGVGLADLLNLIGIHPDTLFSALQNSSSQSFLTLQTNHNL